MDNDKSLAIIQNNTSEILHSALTNVIAGITGIASAEKKELIISFSRILQRLRGGQFLSTLLNEWNEYCQKGKIDDSYQESEQHFNCLQEMLDFLDNDIPNEIRFSVLKKIFLVAALESVTDRNSLIPYEYMKICRKLSSGEILVLNTTYHIAQKKNWTKHSRMNTSVWLTSIAKESGLDTNELVEIHENELMKKRLLNQRTYSDGGSVHLESKYRLTELGYNLCSYIENYENFSA